MSVAKMIQHKQKNHVATWMCIQLLLAILLGLMVVSRVTAVATASITIITVCPAGPPICDYPTIQQGINAAAVGDTVRVNSGIYAENIVLQSGIILEAADNVNSTLITATDGPIVVANELTMTTMRGFTISGSDSMTTAIGIKAVNSDLQLADLIISDLHGNDGSETQPGGTLANALHISGTTAITLTNSTIRTLTAGAGLAGVPGGAIGGEATAVWVDGIGDIVINTLTVDDIVGGGAGSYVTWPYRCEGSGGRAVGVHSSGGANLTISESTFTSLRGGNPCSADAGGCIGYAGAAIGVEASGGQVNLSHNLFSGLEVLAANSSDPVRAIYTSNTKGTVLHRNIIQDLSREFSRQLPESQQPQSPYCYPPPVRAVAIASENDASLFAEHNQLNNIRGVNPFGYVTAMRVHEVPDVTILDNTLHNIHGGSARSTIGIEVNTAQTVHIEGNVLGDIVGDDAPDQFYYLFFGEPGGSAKGITVDGATEAQVSNNIIYNVSGGHGSDMYDDSYNAPPGGDATAVHITSDMIEAHNNTIHNSRAGRGGLPNGEAGASTGLWLASAGRFSALNNSVTSHQIGVFGAGAGQQLFDYNNVMDNEINYLGISPGTHDLAESPGFVDADGGDFHLRASSPLVDAGSSGGVQLRDYEQQRRPADGNGNGRVTTDIGADEYWPVGLAGSQKMVTHRQAEAGDLLTYKLVLANYNHVENIANVDLTDTLPDGITFVEGSLSAEGGTAVYANGTITWSGSLPANHTKIVTFEATVDENLAGTHAIINQAVLDDYIRSAVTIQAVTYVNPFTVLLPITLK